MKHKTIERIGYTINEVLAAGAFPNRTKLYSAINRGDIEFWKDGRSTMISAESVRKYINERIQGGAK